eukprot:s6847_g1.t1
MSDWDIIQNAKNYHCKVAAVCKRPRSLGVRSLAEQSVKSAVGTILSGFKDMPDQATMYQMVQDVKLGFASIPMPTQGDIVVEYPEDPTKLSSQLYAQYENHPPEVAHWPEVIEMQRWIKDNEEGVVYREITLRGGPPRYPMSWLTEYFWELGNPLHGFVDAQHEDLLWKLFGKAPTSLFGNEYLVFPVPD